MRVAVLEPPFLEPSLPRPPPFRAAEVIRRCGHEGIVVDANMLVYRGLVAEPAAGLVAATEPDRVLTALQMAWTAPGSDALQADIPRELQRAVACWDPEALGGQLDSAVSRLSGCGFQGHALYVRDVQLANVFLTLAMNQVNDSATLTLHGFDGGPFPGDSQQVLSWASAGANPLRLLFDRHVSAPLLASGADRVLVVITEESQLVGGLSLAHWVRTTGLPVAVAGRWLDKVRVHYDPPDLPEVAGRVLEGRLEDCLPGWLGGAPGTAAPLAETIPLVNPNGYFSPLPVVGAVLTQGCYWARCRFCQLSERRVAGTRSPSSTALADAFEHLSQLGVHHVQLFDYAVPPRLLERIADAGYRDVKWCGQARFEPSLERNGLFEHLRDAGCVGLSWGFETASARLLSVCRKGGLDGPGRLRLLRNAAEAGLQNHVFAIAGLPSESEDDFVATLRWLEEAIPWLSSGEAYPFQLQAGTPFHVESSRFGLAELARSDWDMNVPFEGMPSTRCASERARALNAIFTTIASARGTHDWLEGHMVFSGRNE